MIDNILITKTMKTGNNMNFQGSAGWANKIMRDSNSNSRRATGQGGYVINNDLQQVDEASYCKEAGKTGAGGRKQKLVNKTNTNTNVGVTLTNDGTSSNDERTLTPNSQLFIFQGKFENKTTASKL